jgi:hypothetical protein
MWLRLRQIALVAGDLEPVVEDLHEIFGVEVAHRDPAVAQFGLHNAVFPLGNQFLEVVAPVREGTAAGRYLERRNGDGGYMVILQCDDHGPRKRRVDELGIRKVIEHDTDEYKLMQLHPRDTGGSFLEIDEQTGGADPDGPWSPAGADWQRARTDVLRGMAVAEVQSPDPAELAERWSGILDSAVETDEQGRPVIRLENASIRFVPDTDGRGEGLGGVDVVAGDPAHVLAMAEKRGRLAGDTVVEICGTRFTVT